jgi:hypothetical protein
MFTFTRLPCQDGYDNRGLALREAHRQGYTR